MKPFHTARLALLVGTAWQIDAVAAADQPLKVVDHLTGGIDDASNDANGNPFDATTHDLDSQGVAFRVCNITLVSRGVDQSCVVSESKILPSGVAEVTRLQAREDHVYLRP